MYCRFEDRSNRGIVYDTTVKKIKVNKQDFYDQNEHHVLLKKHREDWLAWKQNGKIGRKPDAHEFLKFDLWRIVERWIKFGINTPLWVKKDTDLVENMHLEMYSSILDKVMYYCGNTATMSINAYFFYNLLLKQEYQVFLGKFFHKSGTNIHRMNINDFLEITVGEKIYSIGGGKVSNINHKDQDGIESTNEYSDTMVVDLESFGDFEFVESVEEIAIGSN